MESTKGFFVALLVFSEAFMPFSVLQGEFLKALHLISLCD